MIVKLVGCDNPTCKSTAEPSRVTSRSHTAPSGWLTTKVLSEDFGVAAVETCSIECIPPAVFRAIETL